MIECYYHYCEHHSKYEPFCNNMECLATEKQLIEFKKLRKKEEDGFRMIRIDRNDKS